MSRFTRRVVRGAKLTQTGGFIANVIGNPHIGGYPDETNTGVPSGTTLTSSGSITVSTNGTILDSLDISGQVVVNANNVTIRNCRITSGDYYPIDYSGHTGLLVQDTEIIGLSYTVTAGISFDNYTARRVNVHGTADGMKANANVLIEDCYIHDLIYDAVHDTHNDGVQTTGGSGVTIQHTTIKLSTTNNANAAIQIGTESGANSNWLVNNCLLDGGGWTINAGSGNSNMTFTNNRFTKNYGYGIGDVPGATWTGNYYDDTGAAA